MASETNLNTTLEENLIDIRNDVSLNVLFCEKKTSEFLISIYELHFRMFDIDREMRFAQSKVQPRLH